jgi:uncharacterized membrane protein
MTLVVHRPYEAPVSDEPTRPMRVIRERPSLSPVILALLAVAATVIIALDVSTPVLRPLAGLFLLVGLPTYVVVATKRWIRTTPLDTLLCSFVVVLLAIILGGLAINAVLPLLGIARPLDRVPVLVATGVALVVLAVMRRNHWRDEREFRSRWAGHLRGVSGLDRLVLGASLLLVVASIAGAIRLNNRVGGGVTMGMLCGVAVVLVALIRWRWRLRHGTIALTIYLLALALLFMTSLRGWGIIGHDSQVEFYVFQLTKDAGLWRMDTFQSAYNACLSINILPTVVSEMTGMTGAYVFKVLFPLAFAICPVMTYLGARRVASTRIAVLAAAYFIAFPTFFTDMPFLNRQAIAFLFLGMIILVTTNTRWAVQRRQVWVAALSVGVVLSHYSTTYVLIAVLVAALVVRLVVVTAERLIAPLRRVTPASMRAEPRMLGFVNVAILGVLAVVWTGPITHTGGQVEETTTRLTSALFGGTGGQQSSDVAYSILGAPEVSREQRMQDYVDDTLERTAEARAQGGYFPVEILRQYPTPVVEPEVLPLTPVGRALEAIGIDVLWVNTAMRKGAAQLLQLFVCIGFLFVLLRRARGVHVTREMYFLAVGSFGVIAAQVVLPTLSVDYGVLRAFQQSLLILAPFLAAGSVHSVGWLGARWSSFVASALAVWFVLSLTGVVPQALGGYGPQLHLNNAGEYYDQYYTHPEEAAAADWVEAQLLAAGQGVVKTQIPGRLLYGLTPEIGVDRAIHPAEVGPHDYVLLGTPVLVREQAAVAYAGDRLTYRYPIDFLDQRMDLVFHDGKAMIYR